MQTPLPVPVTPAIEAAVVNGDYVRAGGDCVCETCGRTYWRHPVLDPYSWLHVLCDGLLVKL